MELIDLRNEVPRRRYLAKMAKLRITETGMQAGGPGIFATLLYEPRTKVAAYTLTFHNFPKPLDEKKQKQSGKMVNHNPTTKITKTLVPTNPSISFRPHQIDNLIEALITLREMAKTEGLKGHKV